MTRPNPQISYTFPDGRLTIEGLQLLLGIEDRLARAERKLAAIAVVAAPTGGATVDAEARAQIVAILGAAG
jgi:hypothetical protein